MNQISIATAELLDLTAAALAPAGEPAASIVARALVDAEVRGQRSFGLCLLERLPDGSREDLTAQLRVDDRQLRGAGASLTAELAGTFAPAAVAALLGAARERAAEQGICLVRLLNVGTFGRLAPYVARIAETGAIGLLTMSSPSFVTPFGGHVAVLGTNPFAIAVPTDQHPLVVDSASSAITAAHWKQARDGLLTVPDGALVDGSGQPTTDAREAVAIAPRGGLFGSSVGVAVEALAAAATGLLSDAVGAPRGGLLIVIEPAAGAAAAGSELAQRLVRAGGHLPGQPLPWPSIIEIDPAARARLERLASLT